MLRTLLSTPQAEQQLRIFNQEERPPFLTENKPEMQPSDKDVEECHKLLQRLIDSQQKIKQKLASLKQSVQDTNYNKGMGYYNCKNLLFIEYLIHLQFYQLFKINAVDLTQDQGLSLYQRLVYLKTLMTKLSPIQKKLQYQKNKLLKHSDLVAIKAQKKQQAIQQQGEQQQQDIEQSQAQREDQEAAQSLRKASQQNYQSEEEDVLAYQPRPQALLKVKQNKEKLNEKDAKYVAPKISAVLSKEDKIKRRRQIQEQRRKAFLIRKYRDDLMDDEDAREQGVDDVINEKIKRKFKQKTQMEQQNFMRLPESKQQKFWRKSLIRNQSRNNHLQDELKDIKMIREIFQEKQKEEAGPSLKRNQLSKGKNNHTTKKIKRQ